MDTGGAGGGRWGGAEGGVGLSEVPVRQDERGQFSSGGTGRIARVWMEGLAWLFEALRLKQLMGSRCSYL